MKLHGTRSFLRAPAGAPASAALAVAGLLVVAACAGGPSQHPGTTSGSPEGASTSERSRPQTDTTSTRSTTAGLAERSLPADSSSTPPHPASTTRSPQPSTHRPTTTPPGPRPKPTGTPGRTPTRAPTRIPGDQFRPVVSAVTDSDVRYTFHAGCPVGRGGLRKIEMGYRGYDDTVRRGELIVAASRVDAFIAVFRAAFDSGFQIYRMDNPNLWLGDDEAMMAADNTSAFNCRAVTGNPSRLSPHSYGTAFDVNPKRNPYKAANDVWYPPNGAPWIDRSLRDAGMLFRSSALTRAVLARGGIWGGTWTDPDYQHLELR